MTRMTPKEINILLLDENPKEASLIREKLSDIPEISVQLTQFDKIETARELLLHTSASLILISINSSASDELEKIVRIGQIAPSLPIIALIGAETDDLGLQVIRAGAEEYLVKNKIEPEILARTFRYAIERKKSSDRANESEKRYKELVNMLPQIVFEMDLNGIITFANELAVKSFGYDPVDFSNGFPAIQMIAEKDRAR
ncbi:MAG: PAS domain S-box protein, partial [Melioribacteraceae bacterium]